MPDYKALYFELFRASEQAARLLHEAQRRAEQQVMEAQPPALRLGPKPQAAERPAPPPTAGNPSQDAGSAGNADGTAPTG